MRDRNGSSADEPGAGAAGSCRCARLPDQIDPARRTVCARGRHRYHCAPGCAGAHRQLGPVGGGRQPRRRRRHPGGDQRRQGIASRWLYDVARQRRAPVVCARHLFQARLRSTKKPHTDRTRCKSAIHSGSAPIIAGQLDQGAYRVCEEPSRRRQLRVRRQRFGDPSRHRAAAA